MTILTGLWTLPDTIIGSFVNADWQAARRRGRFGVVRECWRSLLGTNTAPYFVPTRGKGSASIPQLQRLMHGRGIRAWGWGVFNGEIYWRVREQQSWLVANILWRHGIRSLHREF